jgi:hypothetical protein
MTWWPLTSTERRPAAAARGLTLALGLTAAAPACGPPRAELEADRDRLREVLALDGGVSQTMHRADQAMATGATDEARRLMLAEAKPTAAENARRAERAAASTEWGRARRAELVELLRERAAGLDEYAAAMGSGDAERVLAALERQQAIERRALGLVRSLERPP